MKKIFYVVCAFLMTGCALFGAERTTRTRIETRVLSLFSAYSNKNMAELNRMISRKYPDGEMLRRGLLNVFLSRDDIAVGLVSLKTAQKQDRISAEIVFDVSFVRAAATFDDPKSVSLRKAGTMVFCNEDKTLKLCAMMPNDLLF